MYLKFGPSYAITSVDAGVGYYNGGLDLVGDKTRRIRFVLLSKTIFFYDFPVGIETVWFLENYMQSYKNQTTELQYKSSPFHPP